MVTDKELAQFLTNIWRMNSAEEEVAEIGNSGYSPDSNFIKAKVEELRALISVKEPSDEELDEFVKNFQSLDYENYRAAGRGFSRSVLSKFGGVRQSRKVTSDELSEKYDELDRRDTTTIANAIDLALWAMASQYPDFAAAEAKIAKLEECLIEMHEIAADQMRTLEQRDAEIRELNSKERRFFCEYCGELISSGTLAETDANLSAAMEHVKNCPKNPHIARIASLEAALAKANSELGSKVAEGLELLKKLQKEPTVTILFDMLAEIDQRRGNKSVCLNMYSDRTAVLRYGDSGRFRLESSEISADASGGEKNLPLAEMLVTYISFLKAPIDVQLRFAQEKCGDGMLLDVVSRINPDSLRVPTPTPAPASESAPVEAAA